ncbi:MAG: efflux RND transporter periplasmic adaptor subunit [Campylobacterales bacterium]
MENNAVLENDKAKSKKRNRFILGFVLVVAGIGAAYGVYWYQVASKYISTDNAYTAAEIAQVAPSVGGTVEEIFAKDTQIVKAGDVLVKLDQTDAKIALNAAKADLERANAGLLKAETEYDKAKVELSRRSGLAESGSVSKDELTEVQSAEKLAKTGIESAKAQIAVAKARLEQAEVDLGRTVIKAPIGGIVAKRQVQLGQRVQVGAPLLSIVPSEEVHVDANFKEGQLKRVKVGQKATIYADIYGKHVIYNGIVEGFSGGTGAAFAIIPAQNATGNWIKVVQRLPIRIKLDANELKANPLKVGLSMNVKIDTTLK